MNDCAGLLGFPEDDDVEAYGLLLEVDADVDDADAGCCALEVEADAGTEEDVDAEGPRDFRRR